MRCMTAGCHQRCYLLVCLVLGQVLAVFCKQNLSLPQFEPSGQEFGPICVKSNQEYCVGKRRSYGRVGTVLNGSYQAPELADLNGDGRQDLITVSADNNSVMIFYNQGYGRDNLPVFEDSASIIIPSNWTIWAVHAVEPLAKDEGGAALTTYLLLSIDINVHGDLIIPMLDNVGTPTQPDFVWRYGNDSFLRTLDLKGAFVSRNIYLNLKKQGTDVSALLGLGDMDGDGDLDLVVQLTWLTFYYKNIAPPNQRVPIFVEQPTAALVTTSLRFYGPPAIYDMDNDGDLDIISFTGDGLHGTRAVVYENIGTKYHPEMHELTKHHISDLYESACMSNSANCTLTIHDLDMDGHDDILLGGLDVGSILVYPQDQATSSLFLTPWNNPFDVLQTETNIFFYYEFVDADGDGDVDMYVSSWLISPVRTLQIDAYENQGSKSEPVYVLRSSSQLPGLYYFTLTTSLNRTNSETGLPVFDFLLTNGSEIIYVLRNQVEDNLEITSLTEPEPLFNVGCPAGKVYFFDDNSDGQLDMFVVNAYGDIDGMLESQLYTTSRNRKRLFQKNYQRSCNRIDTFLRKGNTPWRDGLARPEFTRNGSTTLNVTGCISDIALGDYRDRTKPTLLMIVIPQGKVYQFEPKPWSKADHVLQLSEGTEFAEATIEADVPISLALLDSDSDGSAGIIVAYTFSVRSWRNDYCEFNYPCWNGGKCDLESFHPRCDCSTGFAGAVCDTCAPDHFGKDCQPCPAGESGDTCSSKGKCDWGGFASGECICTAPFWGPDCSDGVCPAGTETLYNFANATFECELCKASYFKATEGDQSCIRCPPFSRASDDRTTCHCNPNYYLSEVDEMLVCEDCPAPMITMKEGATSIYSCVCPAGYYFLSEELEEMKAGEVSDEPRNDDSDHHGHKTHIGTCVPCPPGAACTVPGITLETLPLLPSYWRISSTSAVVGRCKLEVACPGTDLMRWKEDVWLKGSAWDGFQDSLCGDGYVGPFCSSCAPGHFKRNRRCLPCAPKAVTTRNTILGFMAVILLALLAWAAYRRVLTPHLRRVFKVEPYPQPSQGQTQQHLSSSTRPHALSTAANPVLRSPIRNTPDVAIAWRQRALSSTNLSPRQVVLALPAIYKRLRAVVGVKLRLLIIYLQVVSCLWNILDLDASEDTPIDDITSTLQWINLDFTAFPSYQCVMGDSYYDLLLMYTYIPVLALALLWAGTLLLCKRALWEPTKVTMYKDYATTGSLGVCFLLFAGASTRLLNFFACIELDDGHLYNTSDMRVRCDVPSYTQMKPFVVIGILLYPIGITCLYAYLLYTDRSRICARPDKSVGEVLALRDADVIAKRSRFLWSPYEPRVWWFEVAECIRRLSLTAFLSVYETGQTQQTVAAILLSVIAIIVFDHYVPYASDEDDSMGKVCNYVTLLTFLVALLTKLGFITRVYITELLLFLLALFVVAFGTALALKEFYAPAIPAYLIKSIGRRRSSLLKKRLKTMDANAGGMNRLQGLGESQRITTQHHAELQSEEAVSTSPSAQATGSRGSRTREQMSLTDRAQLAPLPPLPPQATRHQHQHMSAYCGTPQPHTFAEPEPGVSTMSATFNVMVQLAGTGGTHSTGRYDQLDGSGSAHAIALQATTQRRIAEGEDGVAFTVPPPNPYSLNANTPPMQEHAWVEPPSPPQTSDSE